MSAAVIGPMVMLMRPRLLLQLLTFTVMACGHAESATPAASPSSASAASSPSSASSASPTPSSSAPGAAAAALGERVEADGLRITDVTVGPGREVKSGDKVVVHYTGKLEDGYVFDSSHKRKKPFEVTIGVGKVIRGWDRGIVGMREGGTRHLVIPPALAYGDKNVGAIPPGSTLAFDVELLEIKP